MTSKLESGPNIARLRPKNQLTLPDRALTAAGARVGDRFVVTVEDDAIRLQPVRDSYAGSLADVFPTGWPEELRASRDEWPP